MDQSKRIAIVYIGERVEANDTRPTVQYRLGDHLENSTLILDDTGQWISYEEYSPYGETMLVDLHGSDSGSVAKRETKKAVSTITERVIISRGSVSGQVAIP